MSRLRKNFNGLAAVLAIFCAMPLYATETVGTITGVMGTVKVFNPRTATIDRRGNKASPDDISTWANVRLNMTLRENDMISTLAESEARLELPDGSTVRLRENTTIEVAVLKGGLNATNARVRLADGSLVANVVKMAGGRTMFELETPTSLAAIRGTTVELNSRHDHGTTLKTFDGKVGVAPAGSRNFTDVGNFQMTEVAPGQQFAIARAVPSFYRPRTTKLLSEEETEALTGFRRIMLTYAELEDVAKMLENDGIPASIGIGISDTEMIARTISADDARTQLATAMETQVQRISESYAQNIGGQAKEIWEESVRQITNVTVRGSAVHTTITQFNPKTKQYRVYSLMVLRPDRFKNAVMGAANRLEEELQLRVKKDDMLSRMDAAINAFNTRYHDR